MFAASKSGRAGASTDPFFPYVSLSPETTSTNGQQNNTFLDSSTNNFTITRNGTPTQGSVTPYWPNGYWGNYFNGSSDYLTTTQTSSGPLDINSGNFTLEAWIYPTSFNSAQSTIIGARGVSSNNWELRINQAATPANAIQFYFTGGSLVGSSVVPALNTWSHVAIVRSANTVTIYLNGVSVGSNSSFGNGTSVTSTLWIGIENAATDAFPGYISNLRLVKGTAVYTAAFTPPTTPLTAITNTSLLTCQSNRFIDNSTNNFTITRNGTPRVQAFQPFSPTASYTTAAYGGSGYFNGSSDYLSVAYNANLSPGAGNFTIEFFYNSAGVSSSSYATQISNGIVASASSGAWSFGTKFGASNAIWFAFYNGTIFTDIQSTSVNPNDGAWHHLAAVRSGSTITLYFDGVSITSGSSALTLGTTDPTLLGYNSRNSAYVGGYISNLRLVKGTAVYTGAFTPPTLAPLTTAGSTSAASYPSTTNVNTSFASSATSLLTNFTNAGIYDAAVQNNTITVGDAQSSTTQYKWSPTSMKFDGTGDWLTAIDGPQLQLGTGDFTIDGWFYLAANGVAYGIVSKGTASTGWSVNVTSGNRLQFSYTASNLTGATTTLAATTWYYFAVVRSGSATGNLKIYINGAVEATSGGAVTDNFNQTDILYVGASRTGTTPLNGYLQDVRITKYARTITTPTAAFPTR